MAYQPTQDTLPTHSGIKRKLDEPENDAGDDDEDIDLQQTEFRASNEANPAKRHTEATRLQNTDIPFEDRLADNEDGNSSDSEFEYHFIDDETADNDYVPIDEKVVHTKHQKNAAEQKQQHDAKNVDAAIRAQKVLDSALELNWSDEDDCIEQYESDAGHAQNNNNNNDTGKDAASPPEQIAWFPAQKEDLNKQQKMQYDKSAYNVLFEFHTEWPCLTFDVITDNLGASRSTVPYCLYLATGSQADPSYRDMGDTSRLPPTLQKKQQSEAKKRGVQNKIHLMKLNDIQKTKYDDDQDDVNEEKDAEYERITDDDPTLQNRDIYHPAVVNRIRTKRITDAKAEKHLVATMSDDGNLYVYDATQHILSLDGLAQNLDLVTRDLEPVTKSMHSDEGYGLAWNKQLRECTLLTGSCAGELRLYQPKSSHFVRTVQFKSLKESIEDIEWSPAHKDVFVSVGVDRCVRVWDARNQNREHVARIQNAHRLDINVCSWNPHHGHQHLFITGSDDHSFKIWDLRKMCAPSKSSDDILDNFSKKLKKCGHYYLSSWHLGPITSVEWHPNDPSCAMVSSEDNQITIWDFSLEEDESENTGAKLQNENIKLPPQLIFMHGGQQEVKEVRFHPQIPNMCISTAASGFHLFQPDNLMEAFKNQFQNLSIVD
eukprot:CAMPEP_0202688708 /NCGR_PEP_ID=MMETSP1385-20130828/4174_1 /ASSEMBLY_ACC=CAM_ASM_000861 /TAXON_ID=933848 /ORGANISM="Elphidium margaritaceum" /LENGTH=656 /DNA_ID=CAMNT_0049343737 /DNA_START=68 /DNA_END=2038 /DNA_ORIENTATION=-